MGYILQPLGIANLLGSRWALVPCLVAAILMVIQTILEDHMRQSEQPGYREYAQQVHYRLLLGLW